MSAARRVGVLSGHFGGDDDGGGARRGAGATAGVAERRAALHRLAGVRHEGRDLPNTWHMSTYTNEEMLEPDGKIFATPVLQTKVDPNDPVYQKRVAHNAADCDELQRRLKLSRVGGGGKYEKLAQQRGKALARERLRKIVDKGTEIMELSPLAAWGMYGGGYPSGGWVTAIGVVAGRECVFICNEGTVKGGLGSPMSGKKFGRAQDISLRNHIPCIYLVDGGGAKLDAQSGDNRRFQQKKAKGPTVERRYDVADGQMKTKEEFVATSGEEEWKIAPKKKDLSYAGGLPAGFVHGGKGFDNQIRMEAMGIPQIAITCGGATAGSAYFVALCSENVIIHQNGTVYLGGPPLVQAATGEIAENEPLGGARMHTTKSGTVDHYAATEDEGLAMCRAIVENLGRRVPRSSLPNVAVPEPPLYDPETILGVIPEDADTEWDIREAIARIVDGSRFHQFRQDYGPALVCGWAHIEGYPVGIVANNGLLDGKAAQKASQFVQICGVRAAPLVFMHNTKGFAVGKAAEEGGALKHAAGMIAAVTNAPVPKFAVICGHSIGAGNFAMCGSAFGPRFTFAWPSARVAAKSGAEAAAEAVAAARARAAEGGLPVPSAAELADIGEYAAGRVEGKWSAWHHSSGVYDDGLIDPRDTRKFLANAISISLNAPLDYQGHSLGHGNATADYEPGATYGHIRP